MFPLCLLFRFCNVMSSSCHVSSFSLRMRAAFPPSYCARWYPGNQFSFPRLPDHHAWKRTKPDDSIHSTINPPANTFLSGAAHRAPSTLTPRTPTRSGTVVLPPPSRPPPPLPLLVMQHQSLHRRRVPTQKQPRQFLPLTPRQQHKEKKKEKKAPPRPSSIRRRCTRP